MAIRGRWLCVLGVMIGWSANAQVVDRELYTSIGEGRLDKLKLYLDSGGNPSAIVKLPNVNGDIMLLDFALQAGNEDATVTLLQAGAQPRDIDFFVMSAAHQGFIRVFGWLDEQDPFLVPKISPGDHPLLLAARSGNRDMVTMLLRGIHERLSYAEQQPVLNAGLQAAIKNPSGGSRALIVRDLLDAGADPVSTEALAGAVAYCVPELVSMFLDAGADAKRAYDLGSRPARLPEYGIPCFAHNPDAGQRVFSSLRAAGANLCVVDLTDTAVPERARAYLREVADCH